MQYTERTNEQVAEELERTKLKSWAVVSYPTLISHGVKIKCSRKRQLAKMKKCRDRRRKARKRHSS